jgi:hypothetical protein
VSVVGRSGVGDLGHETGVSVVHVVRHRLQDQKKSGANPMIVSYNATAAKNYNATSMYVALNSLKTKIVSWPGGMVYIVVSSPPALV